MSVFRCPLRRFVALVAVYEWVSLSSLKARTSTGRIAFYLAGVLPTTVVAGVATAPFALFHFNQVALYGILANIFAVPITGFWIYALCDRCDGRDAIWIRDLPACGNGFGDRRRRLDCAVRAGNCLALFMISRR